MLDDAITNRTSQFRIPTFICGDQSDFDGRIVVIRKSDQQNNTIQFHSDIRSNKIKKLKRIRQQQCYFMTKKKKSKLD
jgi:3-hydroxyisobutyrate dehydrogenase